MDARTERLQIPQLSELCKKDGVAKLSVFGSALREDFSETSDLDVAVELGPSNGLTASGQFFGFAYEVELLYRLKVDLVERRGIKKPLLPRELRRTRGERFCGLT